MYELISNFASLCSQVPTSQLELYLAQHFTSILASIDGLVASENARRRARGGAEPEHPVMINLRRHLARFKGRTGGRGSGRHAGEEAFVDLWRTKRVTFFEKNAVMLKLRQYGQARSF